ncbi:hypothetical protein C5167_021422 [Papaver somniferum]|nr:hypothetical protein C5167_021422 [Papaver somniferum]
MDLDTKKNSFFVLLYVFVLCSKALHSIAADTITVGGTLSGFETITSKDGRFMMGFFTPGQSRKYYLGIWYNYRTALVRTIVWVANRDKPLSGSSSSQLKLSENGNLVLHESESLIWSTYSASSTSNTTEAVLELDPTGIRQYLIKWNKSIEFWKSGEWNEQAKTFTLVPEMRLNYIFNFSFISNENESYFTYNLYNDSILSRLKMDISGQIMQVTWSRTSERLNLFWSQPKQLCDVYGICGPFGNCNQDTLKCECLPGFMERSLSDWNLQDSTGGCVRNPSLQCGSGSKDVFSPIPTSELPDDPQNRLVNSAEECKSACHSNCFCNAYAYGKNGCQLWEGDMLNTKTQSDGNAENLYLRGTKRKVEIWKIMIPVIAASMATLMGVLGYMYLCKRNKANERGRLKDLQGVLTDLLKNKATYKDMPNTNMLNDRKTEGETHELQIFDLVCLAIATNNFCLNNKLGEGGFGPVFKGQLQNRQQIAVKRLSKSSRQGIEEFKNEVELISKLQHRNLVKLLGCCIEGEENMGYMSPEYMVGGTFSEKSDVFSFGVLVLEVVSGKRNNSFYNPEQPLNLLLHAWRLWNEGIWAEIVDQDLGDVYSPFEVMKCIHIGLLCVQNRAVDRPTMAEVDVMLSSETDRPAPKEPPYMFPAPSGKPGIPPIPCSNNNVTLTMIGDDTISASGTLNATDSIISKNGNFRMGFFTPIESETHFTSTSYKYYLGIWYNYKRVSLQTVVWVANRDKPLGQTEDFQLKLLENGNLVLYNSFKSAIWSTNSASSTSNTTEAILGDDGNLVLRDKSNPSVIIWQSFDYPTDTWLPGAKIGFNKKTNKNYLLTSWRNLGDPATGLFSLELDPNGMNRYVTKWNKSIAYWTSAEWNEKAKTFRSVPEMSLNDIHTFSYISNENESYFTYHLINSSAVSQFELDFQGKINQYIWSDIDEQWYLFRSEPEQLCDIYGICGPFGICNNQSMCECFPGFVERSRSYSYLWDSTSGCRRNTSLQCGSTDAFSPIPTSNLPDKPLFKQVNSMEECKSACQRNCSCNAYAYGIGGCQLWEGDMWNAHSQSDGTEEILYLRRAEVSKIKGVNLKIVIPVIVFSVAIIVSILGYIYLYKKNKATERGILNGFEGLLIYLWKIKAIYKKNPNSNMFNDYKTDGETQELEIFNLACLSIATNNFCLKNKLGQGGFGPVYKGKLQNGKQIAVKRLSKSSGQGIEEFKNEVVLISKLQHRNLVKLVGCCVEGEENIGYMSPEYMIGGTFSEKSDVFSFGVLLLEVVSGKRNNSFYNPEQPLNLLLHAWRLWNEGKWSDIVDEDLGDMYSPYEVMKCIHIGLLCGQNSAVDRPTMADVDRMLGNETDRTAPKEPPYTFLASSDKPAVPRIQCSNNNVTLTKVEGR